MHALTKSYNIHIFQDNKPCSFHILENKPKVLICKLSGRLHNKNNDNMCRQVIFHILTMQDQSRSHGQVTSLLKVSWSGRRLLVIIFDNVPIKTRIAHPNVFCYSLTVIYLFVNTDTKYIFSTFNMFVYTVHRISHPSSYRTLYNYKHDDRAVIILL